MTSDVFLRKESRMVLAQHSVNRIRTSMSIVRLGANEFTSRFYARLFSSHPELRKMFPSELSAQKQKLLAAMELVVANLDCLDKLEGPLSELGNRHQQYGVRPEHFDLVHAALLESLEDAIGPTAWTVQLSSDWCALLKTIEELMRRGFAEL